jgi:hypothetical protein
MTIGENEISGPPRTQGSTNRKLGQSTQVVPEERWLQLALEAAQMAAYVPRAHLLLMGGIVGEAA